MFDTTDNPFLSPQELSARYCNLVTIDTMEKWRREHIGPSYYKFGGKVLYRLSDVLIWEQLMRRTVRGRHDRRGVWPRISAMASARSPLARHIAAAVDDALDPAAVDWVTVIDQIDGRAA